MEFSNSFSPLLKLSDTVLKPTIKSKNSRRSENSRPSDYTSSDDPATLSTFYGFPNLPDELKLEIWEHTIEPRCIKIATKKDCYHVSSGYEDNYPSTPSVLHVNKLSRHEFLPRYRILFEGLCKSWKETDWETAKPNQKRRKMHGFWYNPATDILTIHERSPDRVFFVNGLGPGSAEDLGMIQCIALEKRSWFWVILSLHFSPTFGSEVTRDLSQLHALKTILLVGGRDDMESLEKRLLEDLIRIAHIHQQTVPSGLFEGLIREAKMGVLKGRSLNVSHVNVDWGLGRTWSASDCFHRSWSQELENRIVDGRLITEMQ